MTEVCEAERNRQNPANCLVNSKQTCLTGPLEYKYRVIFNLYPFWALFVLYEVQLNNKIIKGSNYREFEISGDIW